MGNWTAQEERMKQTATTTTTTTTTTSDAVMVELYQVPHHWIWLSLILISSPWIFTSVIVYLHRRRAMRWLLAVRGWLRWVLLHRPRWQICGHIFCISHHRRRRRRQDYHCPLDWWLLFLSIGVIDHFYQYWLDWWLSLSVLAWYILLSLLAWCLL